MKCFHYFKERSRSKEPRSEPILKNTSYSSNNSSAAADQRMIKSSGSTTSPRGIPQMFREKGMNLRVFSFSELREATNDFSRLLKIGEGGFGSVYKATIKPDDSKGDRILVAIKQLNRDGFQGHKQWVAEVQFLGVVEHSNLVKLIGYCGVDGERGIQRLLVYEFMPNKSLEDHLFSKAYTALSWPNRLQIMLGAAQGLTYLHEELEVQVIFRDFKSSNVLLDEDFKPKLSDFGLAREGPTGEHTHVSTEVMGTSGYAAPDYIETGRLTSKTDVWSFGVVLYEILTGRRSLERNRPRSEQNLLEWIKNYPADSKKFGIIMDPRLESNYSLSAAREIARLADSCLMKSSKDRPTMSQVVERLKQIIQRVDKDSPSGKILEFTEDDDEIEVTTKPKDRNVSESTNRRMAQLVKLGEHAGGGINKRGFMIMQRAKIP